MSPIDLLEETYLALSANKARSTLTILGIVIGIGSVIAMVAVGAGAQQSVQTSIQSAGSNLVIVTPGAQRGVGMMVSGGRGTAQTLTQADADAINAQVTGIKATAPELSRRWQITAKGTNTNVSVIGTTPDYPEVRNVQVDQGTFIAQQDVLSASRVAVLGPTTRDDLFGVDGDAIGKAIRINNIEFIVVGTTVAKGGSGFNNADSVIYIPLSSAQRYLAGDTYVTTISVEAADADTMSDIQTQITNLLLDRHHISDPTAADFSVLNQADIVATASSIANTFTSLLAAIASISLIVGGIGIMNMMLTNVTERTREIGLRKAIGAERSEITQQFLMEAVALTFLGGGIGILLGWGASLAIAQFAGIPGKITLAAVMEAFFVSASIGIIFGYYPARRAAGLNPIDALRYE